MASAPQKRHCPLEQGALKPHGGRETPTQALDRPGPPATPSFLHLIENSFIYSNGNCSWRAARLEKQPYSIIDFFAPMRGLPPDELQDKHKATEMLKIESHDGKMHELLQGSHLPLSFGCSNPGHHQKHPDKGRGWETRR